jgi:hypothetical protein
MSIRKSVILFGVALSMAAFMSGCSSSTKEGGSPADVQKVGDTQCFQCHSATSDALTGEPIVEQYARSLHAELGCESCHGGGAQHNGIGPFPFTLNNEISDAKKAERCAMCHDGVTEFTTKSGETVVAPLSSSPNFSNGNHAKPFLIEDEANQPKCSRCHTHEGSILYGKDGYTGDATILSNTAFQPVLARDPETFNHIKCATCHEHGGNIRQTKTRDLAGNVVTWDPDGFPGNNSGANAKVVSQFDLCTSCHTMNTNDGRLIGSGNGLRDAAAGPGFFTIKNTAGAFKNISTAPFHHNTNWYRILPSTHVDQAASGTPAAGGTTIEGYVIRKNKKNPCYECHGHEFKANTRALAGKPDRGATNFTDWGQSAHAGKLLTIKVAAATGLSGKAQVDAVMAAGVKDLPGKNSAWGHYNWDDTSSRGACQRCHTSTGASNFMKSPSTYDATGNGNDFSHLANWSKTGGSGQNELLYCWGCHQNAGTGKLYAPGARNELYAAVVNTATGTTGSTVIISYPDVNGSNVCMTCHVGREVGENIKAITDADGVLSFVNSHYLTAGAQLFGKSGYTYTGRDYTAPTFFAHDKIGTAAAPGTGTNGPCIGCHMTSANKHKFTNVSSTSSGVITGITSTLCATCHTGDLALTPAKLIAEEEEYQDALEGLDAALKAKGIFFFKGANPYFFKDTNANGLLDPAEAVSTNTYTHWETPYGAALWRDVMGAAFNLNLLAHDPGGFAHNRFYAKRLIWDSIDFIDDGVLNNSVPATLIAQLRGQTLLNAQNYLGSARP